MPAPPERAQTSSTAAAPAWRPRPERALVLEQIRALEGWRRARDPAFAVDLVAPDHRLTREQRLDRDRRRQARVRERDALLSRLDHQLRGGVRTATRPRAVLAHRHAWVHDTLTAVLQDCGVDVVAAVHDGADAVGIAVAEQPDLLLVQQRLPSLTGLEVVAATTAHSRRTLVAVQLEHAQHARAHRAAGAHLVVDDTVRPAELARRLLARLSLHPPDGDAAALPLPRALDLSGEPAAAGPARSWSAPPGS